MELWNGQNVVANVTALGDRYMADNSSTGFLGFILGGVVVVLAAVVFFAYGGSLPGGSSKTVNVDVNLPSPAKK